MFLSIRVISLVFSCLVIFNVTEAEIFIVHGAQKEENLWHTPEGVFHKKLKASAKKKGHEVRNSPWDYSVLSGTSNFEHFAAGLRLAGEIIAFCKTYTPHEALENNHEVIILAHSYGGHVAYYASMALAALQDKNKLKDFFKVFENFETIISKHKPGYQSALVSLKEIYAQLLRKRGRQSFRIVPEISKIITLGTPHLAGYNPIPHPDGVLSVFNFFSHDDLIANQSNYFGVGTPLLWAHEFTNPIRHIELVGEKVKVSHTKLIHPMIAENILDWVDTYQNKQVVNVDDPMPFENGVCSDDYKPILIKFYCCKFLYYAKKFGDATKTAWRDIYSSLYIV